MEACERKVWQILPNCQTPYNSTTIISILTFCQILFRQIDFFTFSPIFFLAKVL